MDPPRNYATGRARAVYAPRAYCDDGAVDIADLECAPPGGHAEEFRLTVDAGLSGDGGHDQASLAQRRVQAAGCAGVRRRRDAARPVAASRHLTPADPHLGAKYEAGALDDDIQAADLLQEYEAKIAALERMVGRQALEIEFLKGALKSAPRPRSGTTSVVVGPSVSPSRKDAG
jgi:hypothetical protein